MPKNRLFVFVPTPRFKEWFRMESSRDVLTLGNTIPVQAYVILSTSMPVFLPAPLLTQKKIYAKIPNGGNIACFICIKNTIGGIL